MGATYTAWYDEKGNLYVAVNRKPKQKHFSDKTELVKASPEGGGLEGGFRMQDVLDTWFSSWLWPIEVFKGITRPGMKTLNIIILLLYW